MSNFNFDFNIIDFANIKQFEKKKYLTLHIFGSVLAIMVFFFRLPVTKDILNEYTESSRAVFAVLFIALLTFLISILVYTKFKTSKKGFIRFTDKMYMIKIDNNEKKFNPNYVSDITFYILDSHEYSTNTLFKDKNKSYDNCKYWFEYQEGRHSYLYPGLGRRLRPVRLTVPSVVI